MITFIARTMGEIKRGFNNGVLGEHSHAVRALLESPPWESTVTFVNSRETMTVDFGRYRSDLTVFLRQETREEILCVEFYEYAETNLRIERPHTIHKVRRDHVVEMAQKMGWNIITQQ